MSERKVINKYYPIDFEPDKVKRVKKPKGALAQQSKVRIALPMSVQCTNCSNFMARGSKFNARKETVANESYLGNPVYRFYFRCSKCFQELTIKTDPKNADYVAEKGLKAGFVLHKAGAEEEAQEAEEKEKLEGFDKMKALEQKALESMAEAELNEAIDTVLYIQSKRAQMSAEELYRRALEALDPTVEVLDEDEDLTEEDLAELAEMQNRIAQRTSHTFTSSELSNGPFIRRITDEEDGDEEIDPIALRSQQARERLRHQQKQHLNGLSDPEESQIHSLAQPTDPTQNLPSSDGSSTSTSPNSSAIPTQKTSSSTTKTLFKVPLVKALASGSPSSNVVIISTSNASSSPSTAATASTSTTSTGLLTSKKYNRRDDDE
jgi:hypothetical protein